MGNNVALIPLRMMVVDSDYQRPLDTERVKRMVKNYDPSLVNLISVVKRNDGKYAVVDGQHTMAMLINLGINEALCKVIECSDKTDEALLFSKLNQSQKKPKYNDLLKAAIASGDPVANQYMNALMLSGIPFVLGESGGNSRKMVCHNKGMRCMKLYGADVLVEALKAIDAAWQTENDAFTQFTVDAMCKFISTYGDEINTKNLIKRLKEISPSDIKTRAVKIGGNANSTRNNYYLALVVVSVYNNKIKNKLDVTKLSM